MDRTSVISVVSDSALEPNRLVRLPTTVAYAPASTDYADGVTIDRATASGQVIGVVPLTAGGMYELSASGAIGPGVLVYQAANGQVAASGTLKVGRSHPDGPTVAANELVRVIYNPQVN